jgi:hypothetical protein
LIATAGASTATDTSSVFRLKKGSLKKSSNGSRLRRRAMGTDTTTRPLTGPSCNAPALLGVTTVRSPARV